MKKLMLACVGVVFVATAAVGAQTKTVTGEKKTVTATVEAIDVGARRLTVKKADGTYEMIYVPSAVKRFESLKVGDKITATRYENIVLRVQPPGAKPVDTSVRNQVTPAAEGTGGTIANQRTITATISAIDMKIPSITFTGPENFKYTSRVEDKAALAKVKVGDKVEITWTDAMLVSIE